MMTGYSIKRIKPVLIHITVDKKSKAHIAHRIEIVDICTYTYLHIRESFGLE